MLAYHGNWKRAFQDSGYLHCSENFVGRDRIGKSPGKHLRSDLLICIVTTCFNSSQLYICQTYERFYAVATVLNNMVNNLVETQAIRLLKHVIRCYLRLSENPRAREALRQCLPEPLRDATFSQALKEDITTKRCLAQLLVHLSDNVQAP